jgi:hypothetical protein
MVHPVERDRDGRIAHAFILTGVRGVEDDNRANSPGAELCRSGCLAADRRALRRMRALYRDRRDRHADAWLSARGSASTTFGT